jgi:hypothetical protein
MDFKLSKEQVESLLEEVNNEKADALVGEGMEKIRQLGKCEGMMQVSKNMLLWSGGAYLTSALMKKITFKSLTDITDKLEDLK